MGYTIHYNPESNNRYPVTSRSKIIKPILILVLTTVVFFFAIKYRTAVLRFLLPGDPDVTAGALNGLIAEIRDGNTKDAITAFCKEIIDHAKG